MKVAILGQEVKKWKIKKKNSKVIDRLIVNCKKKEANYVTIVKQKKSKDEIFL